ncbi:scarecrow-like protein 14 isoform X1 [Coffea arabica]|uniref:Scarecrow-like protein 14 isoform X1 n=2 Tax=Coffea arabica TaxID=13443 RepID=A0A6P6TFC6_COFAR|nr:scarecrow-like protein 33 isoform X1 [Coffea arabica]
MTINRVMDHQFPNLVNSVNDSEFGNGINLASSEQSNLDIEFEKFWNSVNGFEFNSSVVFPSLEQQPLSSCTFAPLYNVSSEVDFPGDYESYPMLKYINQMLMEDFSEEQPNISPDPLALKAAEKSLYHVLGKSYPPSPHEPVAALDQIAESSQESTDSCSQHHTDGCDTDTSTIDSRPILDPVESSGKGHQPWDKYFKSSFQTSSLDSVHSLSSSSNSGDGLVGFLTNENMISSSVSDSDTILQFKKGLEEGNKFLPAGKLMNIDLDKYTLPSKLENAGLVTTGKKDEEYLRTGMRGRKHQHQDDGDAHLGRKYKQSAVSMEEVELSEAFDRILLFGDSRGQDLCCNVDVEQPTQLSEALDHESDVSKSTEERLGTDNEALDLSALLLNCAHSVVADDRRTANDQLKLIKQHACSTGDPQQRLAILFANALEARLAGNGPELYATVKSKRRSAAEELKAFRVYLCAPFRQIASCFANKMILKAASRAKTLHIVDFGIGYGFQWPSLIQQLSNRDGGPPKLRITGIEYPKPGFRPAERIEETGRRLAKYCERFNVPFVYQAIPIKNWEKIRLEELKLTRDEVIVVNCQLRFKNMLDQVVDGDCPRDAVLRLIREINPAIFVSDVLSGQLCAPFFLTRCREALFFFSAVFDFLHHNLPPDDKQRLKFEQEFMGTEVMNTIACEGSERVERAETYKQWQIRYKRAGFKMLPLNQDLKKELRSKVKEGYHKDFLFDEEGGWILQGWKGKIITACSCWVPA